MVTFALLTLMVGKCPVGICPTILHLGDGGAEGGRCQTAPPKRGQR